MKQNNSYSPFLTHLAQSCAGLPLSSTMLEHLSHHWELVLQWNSRCNLTAITDPETAAWLHYRDSLEALGILSNETAPGDHMVDIGSGGGFPGFPLAVALPYTHFTLLEPRRKRASFLEVVKARLGIKNITVVNQRIEEIQDARFAAAVSRATFSQDTDLHACLNIIRPGGLLIAYRASATNMLGSAVHRYTLQSTPRVLEMWRCPQA